MEGRGGKGEGREDGKKEEEKERGGKGGRKRREGEEGEEGGGEEEEHAQKFSIYLFRNFQYLYRKLQYTCAEIFKILVTLRENRLSYFHLDEIFLGTWSDLRRVYRKLFYTLSGMSKFCTGILKYSAKVY